MDATQGPESLPFGTGPSLGDKLKSARLATGKSMRVICDELGPANTLSHTSLAKYELGSRQPSAGILAALSTLYGRPINWFISGGPTLEGVHYRNLKSRVRVSDRYQFEASSQRFLDAYIAIENHLGSPLPQRFALGEFVEDTSTPKDLARAVRDKMGLNVHDPVPSMIEILEGFGIRALEMPTDMAIDGFSARFGDEHVVVLNSNVSHDRARMNTGHELWHVLSGDCDGARADETENKERDAAAFEFASHLLIPTPALVGAFQSRSVVRLVQYKERYGVSLAAMVYRAEKAGTINQATAKRFWVEFAKRGWRRNEPGRVLADRAIRFETLIEEAVFARELDWRAVATVAGVREDELRRRLDLALGFTNDSHKENDRLEFHTHRLKIVR